MSAPARRVLARDPERGVIAGVLAGWAEYLDIDRSVVRAGFVLVSLLTAVVPGVLAYAAMWVVIPARRAS